MKPAVAVVGVALALSGPAAAEDPSPELCYAPEHLTSLSDRLTHVQAALANGQPLRVSVMGTASSATVEGRPFQSYAARLGDELKKRARKSEVAVTVLAKPGQFASEMVRRIKTEVLPTRPTLVIWQTGTVDALRRVDEEAFGEALTRGLDALHQADADVILMDMQFSPVTSSMANLEGYRRLMTWLSQVRDVPLFRRYEIMHYWYDAGVFDLGADDKAEQIRTANLVHACLARLLAEAIMDTNAEARAPAR